jgi:hypothetical protein
MHNTDTVVRPWTLFDVVRHIKNGVNTFHYSAENAKTSYDDNGKCCVSVHRVDFDGTRCDLIVPFDPWQNVHWELYGHIIDKATKAYVSDVSMLNSGANPDAAIELFAKTNSFGCDVQISLGYYDFAFQLDNSLSGRVALMGNTTI